MIADDRHRQGAFQVIAFYFLQQPLADAFSLQRVVVELLRHFVYLLQLQGSVEVLFAQTLFHRTLFRARWASGQLNAVLAARVYLAQVCEVVSVAVVTDSLFQLVGFFFESTLTFVLFLQWNLRKLTVLFSKL